MRTEEPESDADSGVCAAKGTTETGAETLPDRRRLLLGGKRCSILIGCCERHSVVALGVDKKLQQSDRRYSIHNLLYLDIQEKQTR